MENPELKREVLALKIRVKLMDIANLHRLLNAYKVLKNSLYVTSGYCQSYLTDDVANRITDIIGRIVEDEEVISRLELELSSLEVALLSEKTA